MNMRRITALVLCAVLLLSLTACGSMAKPRTDDEERAQLRAILDDVAKNLHPATAGSSLTAARMTADLVTWAATTKMDKKEAAGIVAEWLKEQAPEIRAAFQERLANISSTYGQIVKDGAAGLMESAGVEKDFSNLGSRLKEIVEAILASGGLD